MGYIGSDPKTKESVSTSQLINDSVTNEKIVDDIEGIFENKKKFIPFNWAFSLFRIFS